MRHTPSKKEHSLRAASIFWLSEGPKGPRAIVGRDYGMVEHFLGPSLGKPSFFVSTITLGLTFACNHSALSMDIAVMTHECRSVPPFDYLWRKGGNTGIKGKSRSLRSQDIQKHSHYCYPCVGHHSKEVLTIRPVHLCQLSVDKAFCIACLMNVCIPFLHRVLQSPHTANVSRDPERRP